MAGSFLLTTSVEVGLASSGQVQVRLPLTHWGQGLTISPVLGPHLTLLLRQWWQARRARAFGASEALTCRVAPFGKEPGCGVDEGDAWTVEGEVGGCMVGEGRGRGRGRPGAAGCRGGEGALRAAASAVMRW